MVKQKTSWVCAECGNKSVKWLGQCPLCNEWNTFAEEVEVVEKDIRFSAQKERKNRGKAIRVKDVEVGAVKRMQTALGEFDRLLGGGIVGGSLSLIGGDPGIGKSTLMLQIAQALASQGLTVLYICGEESVEQTSLRARRLGVQSENLYLLSETLFSLIQRSIDEINPDILIVDSIQIVYKEELPSAPGSVAQVRELATEFMHIAKGNGIATFLIGHVTKSGEIAGPRVLTHIVDTVLDFEGDRHHGYRLLRSTKNRFGPTDDIALFQMEQEGLKEVPNPSSVFLQERQKEAPGSCVIPTVEGSRALLTEVQALVAPSAFATSSRKSTGLDQNRLALLLAVLEKRLGYQLHHTDVFVSVVGGMKIVEPAIDLGVLLAIASSFRNIAIPSDVVVIGEVGLSGEIRSVSRIENRLKEAQLLGFKRALLPEKNLRSLSPKLKSSMQLEGIRVVEDAVNAFI